jgi:putative SOS response-associated peptidase YedK
VMARWGLIPFWMKEKPKVPHINARAETVDRLPLFREAFAKRRCLIRRQASTSGSNGRTESSRTASAGKT